MTDQTANPVACELGDKAKADQVLEWTDLGPLAISTVAIAGGVKSTYPLHVADRLEDLVDRENQCCGSWLHASTTRLPDAIRLEITTTNADGLTLIETLAGLRASSGEPT